MLTPLTDRADNLHSGGAVNPCDECGRLFTSPAAAAACCADADETFRDEPAWWRSTD